MSKVSKDKKFLCPSCDNFFATKSSLEIHQLIHRDERPHQCPLCSKKFRQKGHLSQHMRVHDKQKPFKCDMCDRRFTQGSSLGVHRKVVHFGIKPHECKHCHKRFGQKSNLKKHLEKHANQRRRLKREFELAKLHNAVEETATLAETQCKKQIFSNLNAENHNDLSSSLECEDTEPMTDEEIVSQTTIQSQPHSNLSLKEPKKSPQFVASSTQPPPTIVNVPQQSHCMQQPSGVVLDSSLALGLQNLQIAAASATMNQLLGMGWPQLHLTSALLNGMVLNSTLATIAQNQLNHNPVLGHSNVPNTQNVQAMSSQVPTSAITSSIQSSNQEFNTLPQLEVQTTPSLPIIRSIDALSVHPTKVSPTKDSKYLESSQRIGNQSNLCEVDKDKTHQLYQISHESSSSHQLISDEEDFFSTNLLSSTNDRVNTQLPDIEMKATNQIKSSSSTQVSPSNSSVCSVPQLTTNIPAFDCLSDEENSAPGGSQFIDARGIPQKSHQRNSFHLRSSVPTSSGVDSPISSSSVTTNISISPRVVENADYDKSFSNMSIVRENPNPNPLNLLDSMFRGYTPRNPT